MNIQNHRFIYCKSGKQVSHLKTVMTSRIVCRSRAHMVICETQLVQNAWGRGGRGGRKERERQRGGRKHCFSQHNILMGSTPSLPPWWLGLVSNIRTYIENTHCLPVCSFVMVPSSPPPLDMMGPPVSYNVWDKNGLTWYTVNVLKNKLPFLSHMIAAARLGPIPKLWGMMSGEILFVLYIPFF